MSAKFACGHPRTDENAVDLGAAGFRCRTCRRASSRRAGLVGAAKRDKRLADLAAERKDAGPARDMSPDDIARRVVARDPCPRCNVRKDIGCEHTASSLTARP
jgi:hypothetical protein